MRESDITSSNQVPACIQKLLDDNDYRQAVYPHYGCVPDWFIAYKELAKAIVEYFTIEETSINTNGQEEQATEDFSMADGPRNSRLG